MAERTTIFTKIIAGDIPSWKLYEDDRVFAFLDIGPLSHGHCLVVPKTPYLTLDKMSPDDAAAIGRILPRLSKAVMQATGCDDYNVLQNNGAAAGQEVDHVHFHIIPRKEEDGLGYRWNPGKLEEADAKLLQEKIIAAMS